jgi:hypothetical protein
VRDGCWNCGNRWNRLCYATFEEGMRFDLFMMRDILLNEGGSFTRQGEVVGSSCHYLTVLKRAYRKGRIGEVKM